MRLKITTTSKTSIQTQASTKRLWLKLLRAIPLSAGPVRYVAFIAFLFLTLHDVQIVRGQSALFGLKLGMESDRALELLHKPGNVLHSLPYITGKKILNDTIPVTFCKLTFRRSFGFDSSGRLAVIGMTHRIHPSQLMVDHDCTMEWLMSQFGPPIGDIEVNGDHAKFWNVMGCKLTLEAKTYTDDDAFVMIYLYRDSTPQP